MGGKILVIDDGREVRDFLVKYVLAPRGFEVLVAEDGEQGLAMALAASPDLIIADHNMPGRSGIEVVAGLRAAGRDIPTILMTAQGSEALAKEAVEAGVSAYIVKPFETDEMLAAIGRALRDAQRRREVTRLAAELQTANSELTSRLRELEALTSVGHAITAHLDLDTVLGKVIESAVSLTGAEEGSLLLLDEKTGELTMRAAKNFDDEFVRTFRLRSQDSLAGQVIRSGQPFLLDESAPQKIKTTYLVHSLIYVPLRAHARVIGVLGVDNRRTRRAFSIHEQRLMVALADYAAVAVENARLYSNTEAERSKLDTILRQTEDGVIVVDQEKRLMLINPTARAAFGINGADVTGRPVSEIIQHPEVRDLLARSGDDLKTRRREVPLEDGRVFNAHLTEIGGVGQAVVMQDITHLKELDRIKSEFVTAVSHDLRSPLTAILGYVELLNRAGPLNDQQAEFVRRVRFSVQAITALISDLLDLGRIEAGFDTQKEPLQVPLLVRYAVDGLVSRAEQKRIKIKLDMPQSAEPVLGNPVRLRQMAANLIDNAIKYTPDGGTVSVAVRDESDQIIFTVTDTGVGIAPADQPYIFDKFYRARNVKDSDVPGTGLGLSLVKSIVENHSGRVWVDSKLGYGTTFVVVLPKHQEAQAEN
ncbi:MAG: response regulator [Chloroflexi bacterium]|nr:response regulator [Chloroflexota bacterium]